MEIRLTSNSYLPNLDIKCPQWRAERARTGGFGRMNVPSDEVKVTILVDRFRIVGSVHLYPGARMTDIVNADEAQFITITGAEIFNIADGNLLQKTDSLILNKNEIRFFYSE